MKNAANTYCKKIFKKQNIETDTIYFNVASLLIYLNLKLCESENKDEWKNLFENSIKNYNLKLLIKNIDNDKNDWDSFFATNSKVITKQLTSCFYIYIKAIKTYDKITKFYFFNDKSFDLDEYNSNVNLFSSYLDYINDFIEHLKVVFPKNISDICEYMKQIRKGI